MKNKTVRFDLKKIFDSNKFLIVLSVLIAIVSMFVVKITVDPMARLVISDVPVKIEMGGTAAAQAGLQAIPLEEMKVKVSVYGERLVVSNLTADKISVIAKPGENVTAAGEYKLELTALNNDPNLSYEITNLSKSNIRVRFDTFVTKEFDVTVRTQQLKTAEGFIVEAPYVSQKVTVNGPKSDVDKIAQCVVQLNVPETLRETVVKQGEIQFYGTDNQKLELEHVTFEPRSVDVNIPVYKQKTVPLNFNFTNVPDGFPIEELKQKCRLDYSEITIATPNDAIDDLTEWSLGNIDFRSIDIGSKLTLDVTLPTGYRNVDGINKVTVEFPSAGMTSKLLTISSLNVTNAPTNYDIQLTTKQLTNVKIVGPENIVKSISAADVVAAVDLMDVTVTSGQYAVPVKLSIPGKGMVWVSGEYRAYIRATAK